MNQHDRVEQLIAEHDEQAQKACNIAAALGEIERSIGLLAHHVEQDLLTSSHGGWEARAELAGCLDNLRRAVSKVERWS